LAPWNQRSVRVADRNSSSWRILADHFSPHLGSMGSVVFSIRNVPSGKPFRRATEKVAIHSEADVTIGNRETTPAKECVATMMAANALVEFPRGCTWIWGVGGRKAMQDGAHVAVVPTVCEVLLEKKQEGLAVRWGPLEAHHRVPECEGKQSSAREGERKGRIRCQVVPTEEEDDVGRQLQEEG